MSIKEIFNNMEYGPSSENSSAAMQWLKDKKNTFDHYINGQWQQPQAKEYFDSQNPANLEVLAKVAQGNEKDVDSAVKAAGAAQAQWQKLGGHARAKYLYALARQLQKHSRLFAVLETLDNGKPIRESRDIDMPLVARHFYHHAGWAQLMDSEFPGYQPLGVVGQIIPWNFPLLMLAWKVAPALAMGNTVILKPAEFTSATAVLFAQICDEINLPKGVFNLILGDGTAGQAIVEHQDIAKIAFTGSTSVGRIIRKATAGTGKKVSLELGGKSAFIVFEDADLDSVVEGVVDAIWFNQGQVCCAGSRLLMQESIAEKLTKKLTERMNKLVVGDSLCKSIDMGAIIDPTQLAIIKKMVALGVSEGATLHQPKEPVPDNGCYYPPTLMTNVEPASTVAQQEIFGPVLVAMTFRTPAEAVQIANNSRYGLAASVWSENINLALDVAPKIKAGAIWINCTNMFDASCGFGGYRESGFGREGGKEGLYEYIQESWLAKLSAPVKKTAKPKAKTSNADIANIDRTPKLYIGGKQARPDSGYSLPVFDAAGTQIAEVPDGSRKDVRNAVEAANKASPWTSATAHNRAQVLYFIAENLDARAEEFAKRIVQLTGKSIADAKKEIELSISRIFTSAAWADKYEGQIHSPPQRIVTLAMKEAVGNIAIVAPEEAGFLGMISTIMPAIAMGNRVIFVPSSQTALLATDFYQILNTSDLPGGVINIITGDRDVLTDTLAKHYDIDGFWYWGSEEGSKSVEFEAAATMKRTWVNYGKQYDWFDDKQIGSDLFLRKSVEIKNIWVPYGA
ncbi:MAG: aldehyde dehydrogenase family protein [Alteromonadaceae bacterium]|nr:aldehyde dehydrogenase family protein [Alteromonadaceae bacterium]